MLTREQRYARLPMVAPGAVVRPTHLRLQHLIARGWRDAYAEWFGEAFVDALAKHHIEAVQWHWDSRLAFVKGERP